MQFSWTIRTAKLPRIAGWGLGAARIIGSEREFFRANKNTKQSILAFASLEEVLLSLLWCVLG